MRPIMHNPLTRQSVCVTSSVNQPVRSSQTHCHNNNLNKKGTNMSTVKSADQSKSARKDVFVKSATRVKPDVRDSKVSIPSKVNGTAYSVFYPGLPASSKLAGRHKYVASHYEINLMPHALGSSLATQVLDHYATEEGTRIGGANFLNRVRQAALAANAGYTNLTPNVEPLVNAFLRYLYNSRQMYSLLVTAWRCQNMVNAIDEDGRFMAPILNEHTLKLATQGWSSTSFASEVAYTTYDTVANRQAMCFSTATSNGLWANSVVAPIMNFVRLPKETIEWVDSKFGVVHSAQPTDFNAFPRFVVFWPDSRLLDSTANQLIEMTGYRDATATSASASNCTITQLINHINIFVAYCAADLNAYPQLQLMFDMLKCCPGNRQFSRQLDGRTVCLADDSDVTKLIASCSTGYFVMEGSSTLNYYNDDHTKTGNIDNYPCVIERDPGFRTFTSPEYTVDSSNYASANARYEDRVNLSKESDYVYLYRNVAPLSAVMLIHSTTAAFRWTMPLFSLLGNSYTTMGGLSAANAVQAVNELLAMQGQQGFVLGRQRLTIQVTSNYLLGVVVDRFSSHNCYYDLKDYLVNPLELEGWRSDYSDLLSGALS